MSSCPLWFGSFQTPDLWTQQVAKNDFSNKHNFCNRPHQIPLRNGKIDCLCKLTGHQPLGVAWQKKQRKKWVCFMAARSRRANGSVDGFFVKKGLPDFVYGLSMSVMSFPSVLYYIGPKRGQAHPHTWLAGWLYIPLSHKVSQHTELSIPFMSQSHLFIPTLK